MKKSRILEAAKEAKKQGPSWLNLILAYLMPWIGGLIGGLVLAPFLLVYLFVSHPEVLSNPDSITQILDNLSDWYLFLELGSFAFIALLVFFWVGKIEKRPLVGLGFYKKQWGWNLVKGFGLGFLLYSATQLLLVLFGAGHWVSFDFKLGNLNFVLLTIPFWILQGGTEEILTRGWLLPALARKGRLSYAVVLSSLLFACLHLSNDGLTPLAFFNLFLYGLFAAVYLLATDQIWSVMGLHGAWNFAQGNVYGMAVSGQGAGHSLAHFETSQAADILTGGNFGAEGSIATTLVLLVGVWYYYQKLQEKD